MKRFQELSLLRRLPRYRWYATVPFVFGKAKLRSLRLRPEERTPNGALWSIAIGLAQAKMGWLYTHEEVIERLRSKRDVDEGEQPVAANASS